MNANPTTSLISLAESIDWSETTFALLKKTKLQREEIEEAFLNLPTVKKITLSFPDKYQRFFVEGVTDRGKKIQLVMYILKKKIHLTYVKGG